MQTTFPVSTEFSREMLDILPFHSLQSERIWKENAFIPWGQLKIVYDINNNNSLNELNELNEDLLRKYSEFLTNSGEIIEDVVVVSLSEVITCIDTFYAEKILNTKNENFWDLNLFIIAPNPSLVHLPKHTIVSIDGECTQSVLSSVAFLDLTATYCDLKEHIIDKPAYIR